MKSRRVRTEGTFCYGRGSSSTSLQALFSVAVVCAVVAPIGVVIRFPRLGERAVATGENAQVKLVFRIRIADASGVEVVHLMFAGRLGIFVNAEPWHIESSSDGCWSWVGTALQLQYPVGIFSLKPL